VKKKLLAAAGVVVALSGAGTAWFVLRRQAAPPPPAAQAGPPPLPAGAELSFEGSVRSVSSVTVGAPVEGAIELVAVEVGAEVFAGQMLAKIGSSTLESARDATNEEVERIKQRLNNIESALIAARLESSRAEADLSRAKAEYERREKFAARQQMLHREGATPRLTYERAQKDLETARLDNDSAFEMARQARDKVTGLLRELESANKALEEGAAALEKAEAELQAAEVHAPVDGVVIAARAQVGAEVSPAISDLFQIAVDLAVLRVTVEPEPPVLKRIQTGLPVVVSIVELASGGIDGEVVSVADDKVEVAFPRVDPAIKPGQTAQVRIRLP